MDNIENTGVNEFEFADQTENEFDGDVTVDNSVNVKEDSVDTENTDTEQGQTKEQNALFAEKRRQSEASEWKEKYIQVQERAKILDELPSLLSEFEGVTGNTIDEQLMSIKALREGVTVNEWQARQQQDTDRLTEIRKQLLESDPEIKVLKEKAEAFEQERIKTTFANDLSQIKKIYPNEKATDVTQLGEEFMALMSTGLVSPVSAYEAIKAQSKRKGTTPSMGDIGGNTLNSATENRISSMSNDEFEKFAKQVVRGEVRLN